MKPNISQARINQQLRSMLKQPLPYLTAKPLQNDLHTWHFTIQGPPDTDFHQGLYHGQILLPFQYPFKPPDIVFMNKNARFQTNTKICLTITQYHPQEWNSAWTIRTMLQAVMSLFSENVQGIGYEEGSPEQRKLLAKKSHEFKCDKCGVLKDILKPREPVKVQEKKKQEKPNLEIPQGEKLQYAPELTRKIKTEDNSNQIPRKVSKTLQQKLQEAEKAKRIQQKREAIKPQPQTNSETLPKSDTQTHGTIPIIIKHPVNDPIALDLHARRNYITWARVLKSQKWTTIQ